MSSFWDGKFWGMLGCTILETNCLPCEYSQKERNHRPPGIGIFRVAESFSLSTMVQRKTAKYLKGNYCIGDRPIFHWMSMGGNVLSQWSYMVSNLKLIYTNFPPKIGGYAFHWIYPQPGIPVTFFITIAFLDSGITWSIWAKTFKFSQKTPFSDSGNFQKLYPF